MNNITNNSGANIAYSDEPNIMTQSSFLELLINEDINATVCKLIQIAIFIEYLQKFVSFIDVLVERHTKGAISILGALCDSHD